MGRLRDSKKRKMGSCCCKPKKPKQPPFPAKRVQKSASQTPKSVRNKSSRIQEQSMVQRTDSTSSSSSASSSEDQSSINREKIFRSSMHVNVLNNTRTEYHVQKKSMKNTNESMNTTMSGSYHLD